MTLDQYMHERLLHAHIIDSKGNNPIVQLIELDDNGNIVNTHYYIENTMPFSSKIKKSVIFNPDRIDKYKYTIRINEDLYMFLSIFDIAVYHYNYKLYDLADNTFMYLNLTNSMLLDKEKHFAHNRLIKHIFHNNFTGEYAQNKFYEFKEKLDNSLYQYIMNNKISSNITHVNLDNSLFINETKHIMHNAYSEQKLYIPDNIYIAGKWSINQYNTICILTINDIYYIIKADKKNIYRK